MKNMTMEQEKVRKKNQKVLLIMGLIVALYLVLTILHIGAVQNDSPRYDFAEAANVAMLEVITNPFHMAWTKDTGTMILLLFGLGIPVIMLIANNRKAREHDDPDTVNGDARFMNKNDFDQYNIKRSDPIGKTTYDGPKNAILSKDLRLSMEGFKTRRNLNMLVVGGSGAGKSRFMAAPNILQYNSNFIITDPSGELLRDYGKGLEDNGYKVKVFNISDVTKGNRYNPFHYVHSEKDIFVLVNTIMKNTTPPGQHSSDPFFDNAEKVLIEGLSLYLWHTAPPEEQTFSNVAKLINMANGGGDDDDGAAETKLDILFNDLKEYDPDNLAVAEYEKIKVAKGKTMNSILISAGTRLQAFDLSNIAYLTNKDEMELEKFADTKQALFVIIPTADTTFNFIVSMLYSQLFSTLYEYCEQWSAFGWRAVLSNGDTLRVFQAKTAADSPKAKKKAETYVKKAKRGIKITYNKKRKLYMLYSKDKKILYGWRGEKEKAEQLAHDLQHNMSVEKCRASCANHVRFILDEFANIGQIPDFEQKLSTIRKYEISTMIIIQALSQLKNLYKDTWNTLIGNCDTKIDLGTADYETNEWFSKNLGKRTTKVMNSSFQGNNESGNSINLSSIELMTPDQIALMDESETIVLIRGERPFKGKKFPLEKHPNYEYAHEHAGQFVITGHSDEEAKASTRRRLSEYQDLSGLSKDDNEASGKNNRPKEAREKTPRKEPKTAMSPETGERNVKAGSETYLVDNNDESAEEAYMQTIIQSFGVNPNDTQEDIDAKVKAVFDPKPVSGQISYQAEM